MGTSAAIFVKGLPGVCVYKHFDGYPEATLPWLTEFNSTFTTNRGDDPSYKFAQLLRSSARDAEKFNLDDSTTTGWGVLVTKDSPGCDFEYHLLRDGTVTIIVPHDEGR